jgi:hypothetical protein
VTAPEGTQEPEATTVALIYAEIETQLEKQFEQIGALNARAQQLLGFAGLIFTVIASVRPPSRDPAISVLFGIALLLFIAVLASGYLAWSIQGWRRDPAAEPLWRRYRLWPEDWLREQIILNWIESQRHNRLSIEAKLFYLRATHVLLGALVSYLVAMLILRPYVE